MVHKSVALLVLLVAVTSAGEINFRDCGSLGRAVEKVEVSNCDKTKCDVVKGQKYEILVFFTSGAGGSSSLNIDLRGTSSIITSPILVTSNGEGCDGLNTGCPFPGGAKLVHNTTVIVGDEFFELPAKITHKLIDDQRRAQVCIETDVTVVAPAP